MYMNMSDKAIKTVAISHGRQMIFNTLQECADYFKISIIKISTCKATGTCVIKNGAEWYFDTLVE